MITLYECVFILAPAFFHDFGMDGSGDGVPADQFFVFAKAGQPGNLRGPFKHHPAHHLTRNVMGFHGEFPNAALGQMPMSASVVSRASQQLPVFVPQRSATLDVNARAVGKKGQ